MNRSRLMFMRCGQFAHVWEIKLNRLIVRQEEAKDNEVVDDQEKNLYIKPLNSDASFNKGVEYFSEIVFFYGVLFTIALYEIKKSHESTEAQKKKIEIYDEQLGQQSKIINEMDQELQNGKIAR